MMSSGSYLVNFDGYTYHRSKRRRFCCSSIKNGCKASLTLDTEERNVLMKHGEHNHPKPSFYKTMDGRYLKKKIVNDHY